MTKTSEKNQAIIRLINQVIRGFIRDWIKSPYVWGNEVDVQADIVCRLKRILGKKYLSANYKEVGKEKKFCCVCCEPKLYYGGKHERCYPDIVVYKVIDLEGNVPPDEKPGHNWPILWVCEIKYETELGGDFNPEDKKWDCNKLQKLVKKQRKLGDRVVACTLAFSRFNKQNIFECRYRRIK